MENNTPIRIHVCGTDAWEPNYFHLNYTNWKILVIIFIIIDRMILIYLEIERRYYVYKTRSKAEFKRNGNYAP